MRKSTRIGSTGGAPPVKRRAKLLRPRSNAHPACCRRRAGLRAAARARSAALRRPPPGDRGARRGGAPVRAEEIAAGIGGRLPRSDLASVYRNLETLENHGLVRHLHLGHGPGLYALAGEGSTCRGQIEHVLFQGINCRKIAVFFGAVQAVAHQKTLVERKTDIIDFDRDGPTLLLVDQRTNPDRFRRALSEIILQPGRWWCRYRRYPQPAEYPCRSGRGSDP